MIDVCGTGGYGLGTFQRLDHDHVYPRGRRRVVVKHGNRSVTSCCGSADVLEALGVRLIWEPTDLKECVQRHRPRFLFARQYHPAFRALADMRAQLAARESADDFQFARPAPESGAPAAAVDRRFCAAPNDCFRRSSAPARARARLDRARLDRQRAGWTTSRPAARLRWPNWRRRVTSAIIDCRWLGVPQCFARRFARRRCGGKCENARRNLERRSARCEARSGGR